MNEKTLDTNAPADEAQKAESWGSFAVFILKLALLVLVFRSFVFSPFSIPSESMLPRLWKGDYLLAAKRSEEHTSELQSLMRISYAVFCLKKKKYTSK